ncbi:hypothetical protein [Lapillicoccus jejuensis]|uniref:Uncharacterized protein n=1 Tax=Lapillicoccus jejuensis TaxID=402171 RepID=A0A542E5N1_9MICO|nr:hypothetical protein [Lapillicoccus jejuensis]TQJ10641.1 hypothetical protein FB458_3770 [Lapillicoccus jejuensis]
MAEGGVGSVAEETARLLDALLGGAGTDPARPGPPYDAPPGHQDGDPEGDPPPEATHDGPHDAAAAADPASVCHLCPVCQLLRVARSVRPETVDRLADLAAMLTESLREVAASRRTEQAAPPPRPGPDVEDIPLDEHDDEHDDDHDDDHEEPTR